MDRVGRFRGIVLLMAWGVCACGTASAQAPGPQRTQEPWDWFKTKVKGFVGEPLDPRRPSLPPAYPGAAQRLEARRQQASQASSGTTSDWQPHKDPTLTAVKEWIGQPLGYRPRPRRSAVQRLTTAGPEPTPVESTCGEEPEARSEDPAEASETADRFDPRSGNSSRATVDEWVSAPRGAQEHVRRDRYRRPRRVRPAYATQPQEEPPRPSHARGPRRDSTASRPGGRTSKLVPIPRRPNERMEHESIEFEPFDYEPIEDRTVAGEEGSGRSGQKTPDHLNIMREIFHGSPAPAASSRSLWHSRRTQPPR